MAVAAVAAAAATATATATSPQRRRRGWSNPAASTAALIPLLLGLGLLAGRAHAFLLPSSSPAPQPHHQSPPPMPMMPLMTAAPTLQARRALIHSAAARAAGKDVQDVQEQQREEQRRPWREAVAVAHRRYVFTIYLIFFFEAFSKSPLHPTHPPQTHPHLATCWRPPQGSLRAPRGCWPPGPLPPPPPPPPLASLPLLRRRRRLAGMRRRRICATTPSRTCGTRRPGRRST